MRQPGAHAETIDASHPRPPQAQTRGSDWHIDDLAAVNSCNQIIINININNRAALTRALSFIHPDQSGGTPPITCDELVSTLLTRFKSPVLF